MRLISPQVKAALIVEGILLALLATVSVIFWSYVCDKTLASCVAAEENSFWKFLLISSIRPFVFTPLLVQAVMGGEAFGALLGALFTAMGSLIACFILYSVGKQISRIFVRPWLASNLPATHRFLRSQDYKIVLFARLMPFLQFDLFSLIFGVLESILIMGNVST